MFGKKIDFNSFIKRQDFFINIGLILWFSIFNTLQTEASIWPTYLTSILALTICTLPVLVFSFYKEELKNSLTKDRYLLYWL
ncbi:MAG: hypothetical protein EOO47_00880, partial [Flavobacterium sp.]